MQLRFVPVAQIGSVLEVVLAPLTGWPSIVEPVDVLEESEKHQPLAFMNLLLRPSELLTHLPVHLQHFQGLADVLQARSFGFGVLEDASDLGAEDLAYEGA